MKRPIFILLLMLACSMGCWAQSAAKADEWFQAQQYAQALQQYEGLLRAYPQNTLYQYRYARCLQETGNTEKAIHWFEVAGEKYALRNYYLALLYSKNYQSEEAIAAAEKYLSAIDETNERYAVMDSVLRYSKKALRYIKRVEDIAVIDSVTVGKNDFLSAYRLSSDCGSLTYDSAGVVFTNARQDRKMLAMATEKNLVLASCQRLLDQWSACDTLPEPVRQNANINYPFLLTDGVTLYFASDSPDGLGGYDIYQTRYNPSSDTWLTPENIGFPFNSPRNDYMLAIDEQSGVGFFATDRRTSDDSVVVYRFQVNEEKIVLRDTTEEYIRKAAQLLDFRRESTSTEKTGGQVATDDDEDVAGTKTDSELENGDIEIVINDSTVYTSVDDFRSEEARQLATEYIMTETQIAEEEQSLKEQRAEYAEADAERRSVLRSVMLTQEKTLRTLRKENKSVLKQLRAEENAMLKQR